MLRAAQRPVEWPGVRGEGAARCALAQVWFAPSSKKKKRSTKEGLHNVKRKIEWNLQLLVRWEFVRWEVEKKNKKKRKTVTFDFPLSVKAMRQTG
ncbi:MAG: hypothetical protein Phog2KO_50460 [Phototrophicaceae bacterium]